MVMHTNSFDDKWERGLVKAFLENKMDDIIVINPEFDTGKTGDLFVLDKSDNSLMFIVEVELMGKKSQPNVTKMKGYARGTFTPYGNWKPGITIVPRKMELDPYKSNEVKQKLNITRGGTLTWDMFARVIPNGKGVFISYRDDIVGSINGQVNSMNFSGNEERPTIPWDNVTYFDF